MVAWAWEFSSLFSSILSFLTITVFGESEVEDLTTVTPNCGVTVGLRTVTVVPMAEPTAVPDDCLTTGSWAFFPASGSSGPMVVVAVWSWALPKAEIICVICGWPHCFLAASTPGLNTASFWLVAATDKFWLSVTKTAYEPGTVTTL